MTPDTRAELPEGCATDEEIIKFTTYACYNTDREMMRLVSRINFEKAIAKALRKRMVALADAWKQYPVGDGDIEAIWRKNGVTKAERKEWGL